MNTFVIISYVVLTLWTLGNIIFHGSTPTKSLAWVLAVVVMPFAGPFLYYLFGINRRKFKFFRWRGARRKQRYIETYEHLEEDYGPVDFKSPKKERLARLIKSNSHYAPVGGNGITVYDNGKDTFDAIYEAAEQAKEFIHLQYYIFSPGEITERLYQIFERKLAEGVEIRLIYDYVGSYFLDGKIIKRMKAIGVHAYPMMPIRFGNLLYTLNYRNHRKIFIVDGKIGFTGGVNASDKYLYGSKRLGVWKDLHLRMEGPAVNSLHHIFIKDYHFASKEALLTKPRYLSAVPNHGKTVVQIAASGPDSRQPAIMQQYMAMVHLATDKIFIANPYFIPSTEVIQALKIAALSGVKVQLLVPGKSDSRMAKYCMFSFFEELLEAGVEIYLRSDFSHGKMIIIDDEIASVGSGNFDYRSFEHNYETNAILYNKEVAKKLGDTFCTHCEKSTALDYESFKLRPNWERYLEGLSRFFSPLL